MLRRGTISGISSSLQILFVRFLERAESLGRPPHNRSLRQRQIYLIAHPATVRLQWPAVVVQQARAVSRARFWGDIILTAASPATAADLTTSRSSLHAACDCAARVSSSARRPRGLGVASVIAWRSYCSLQRRQWRRPRSELVAAVAADRQLVHDHERAELESFARLYHTLS